MKSPSLFVLSKVMSFLKKTPRILYTFLLFCSSCCIGFHIKPHNPSRAGGYPAATPALRMKGDQGTQFRTCFDVKQYELSMTPDTGTKTIAGEVVITSLALTDIDTFQLDLKENLRLLELKLDDKPVFYYRKYQGVFIVTRHIRKNQRFKVYGKFAGTPVVARKPPWRGGLVWKRDKQGRPWCAVACQTEGTSLWWLCKDVTNDEADTTILHYTCDSSLVMVGNGQLTGVTNEGKNKTWNWLVTYPINTYNITFYLGNYALVKDSFQSITGNWVYMNHYVLKGNEMKAANHFKQAIQVIAVYEKLFGPYPWPRDGYRLVESPYAGMEHQSAIAYGNGYKNTDGQDYIIVHETAHEWWGNAVTAGDLADGWLHEGFATYSEFLYLGKTAPEKLKPYMRNYQSTILNKRPMVHPHGIRYFNYKDGDIYVKGAMTLSTLRTLIDNDSLFMRIIRTFYAEQALKPGGTDTKDFTSCVNRVTGKNYDWFFKQYLYSRKVPVLEINQLPGKGFYYRWTKCDSDFVMPITVTNGGLEYIIRPTVKTQFFEMPDLVPFKTHGIFWTYRQTLFGTLYKQYFGIKGNGKLK